MHLQNDSLKAMQFWAVKDNIQNIPSFKATSPELTIAGSHERSDAERDDQPNKI